MKDFTPAERAAFKLVLINFKRFWNAVTNENVKADKLIDSMVELVKEMDHD